MIVLGNDSLFCGLGIELAEYRQFLNDVASDLSIGETIQQAFIEVATRAGAAFG